MALASGLIGLLIWLVELPQSQPVAKKPALDVQIQRRQPPPTPEPDVEPAAEPATVPVAESPVRPEPADVQVPELEEPTSKTPRESSAFDWRQAVAKSAATVVEESRRKEEIRASNWRQNYSMMFEPGDVPEIAEAEPVIQDFRFRPEVHVAGLGLTIGSCFFGLPVVGIPVEERSVMTPVIYCAKE